MPACWISKRLAKTWGPSTAIGKEKEPPAAPGNSQEFHPPFFFSGSLSEIIPPVLDVAPISGGLGGTERIPAFSKVTYDLHDGSRDTLISLGGDVGVSVAPDPKNQTPVIPTFS